MWTYTINSLEPYSLDEENAELKGYKYIMINGEISDMEYLEWKLHFEM